MAVDARALAAVLPVSREWQAARRLSRTVGAMRKAQLDTLIGGAIALLSVIGVILLALFGREIPDVLGYLAAGSVV